MGHNASGSYNHILITKVEVRQDLKSWNKKVFGNVATTMREASNQLVSKILRREKVPFLWKNLKLEC